MNFILLDWLGTTNTLTKQSPSIEALCETSLNSPSAITNNLSVLCGQISQVIPNSRFFIVTNADRLEYRHDIAAPIMDTPEISAVVLTRATPVTYIPNANANHDVSEEEFLGLYPHTPKAMLDDSANTALQKLTNLRCQSIDQPIPPEKPARDGLKFDLQSKIIQVTSRHLSDVLGKKDFKPNVPYRNLLLSQIQSVLDAQRPRRATPSIVQRHLAL